ncbi:MAG TPA: aminotransferase class III-fold pyridoxal phosphate-dependent enzyme [Solirubrobacterales bacterium]|nr:aminotransferase class III-fold pyridoxal phosphate-dependent enzyme [Solirubrobacterales bacterium]
MIGSEAVDRSELLELYRRHYNAPLARHFELGGCSVETSAAGSFVVDELGREYLDVATAHGIFGIGHCNPAIQDQILAQLEAVAGPTGDLQHDAGISLTSRLAALLPADLNRVLYAGSGSEAIEIALRTALLARPGRTRLIAARNAYHGKTLGALGVMGMTHLRVPFEPLWSDVSRVTYGDVDEIAAAIGDGAAAVLLEPVLAGGTIQVPPAGYLERVRDLCDRTGTLLIVDEVQTGLGRTGKMFGIEHAGVVPDMVVLSKILTGGCVPIAVTVVAEAVAREADRQAAGADYRSESACWPLVAAAADAAVAYVETNRLDDRARRLGAYLGDCLGTLTEMFPRFVVDTPGVGLMRGIRVRNRVVETALWLQLRRRDVIVGLSLNSAAATPVLRIYPPLTVSRAELDQLMEALYDSLVSLERMRPRAIYALAAPAMALQFWLPARLLTAAANRADTAPNAAVER